MKKNDPRLIAGHELEHHVFPTRQNKIENLKRERVKKKGESTRLALLDSASTYSPTRGGSTIGADGLNFSVRDGKRWITVAIDTF